MALPIDGTKDEELSVKGLEGLTIGDWSRAVGEEVTSTVSKRSKGQKPGPKQKSVSEKSASKAAGKKAQQDKTSLGFAAGYTTGMLAGKPAGYAVGYVEGHEKGQVEGFVADRSLVRREAEYWEMDHSDDWNKGVDFVVST